MRATFGRVIRGGMTVVTAATLASCSEPGGDDSTTAVGRSVRPVVHVVNYPLMYFAERVAGGHVDVRFLAPADGDPAFWEPSDEDIRAMQAADLVLLNGASYAKWRGHVSLPQSRLVDTGHSFRDALIEVAEAATHSHGEDGAHSHTGVAFTTWIDMNQARQHVEAVRDALADLVPDARAEIEANAATLLEEIGRLDTELEAATAAIGDQPLVASHPVYHYLARRYGLEIGAVLWEPDTVPDEAAMADLEDLLGSRPARWMIWEGEPVAESVEMLEAIGVRSVVFDPCGNRPDRGDWLDVMRRNVENLKGIE